jgi:hypothetical protein
MHGPHHRHSPNQNHGRATLATPTASASLKGTQACQPRALQCTPLSALTTCPQPTKNIHTFILTGNWDRFYETVKAVVNANAPTPLPLTVCPLQFDVTMEAAENDTTLLKGYGFNSQLQLIAPPPGPATGPAQSPSKHRVVQTQPLPRHQLPNQHPEQQGVQGHAGTFHRTGEPQVSLQ